MADDTDSDWDSSGLDFSTTPRGPRTIGFNQQPPQEMDAIAETSENSIVESGFPERNVKPNSSDNQPYPNETHISHDHQHGGKVLRKESIHRGKVLKGSTFQPRHAESPKPPYNFNGMYESDVAEEEKHYKIPGKNRKGKRYDPPSSQQDESRSQSEAEDADEAILRQVRDNFNKEKQKISGRITKAPQQSQNDAKSTRVDSGIENPKPRDFVSTNSLKTKKEKSSSSYDREKSSLTGGSIVFSSTNNPVNPIMSRKETVPSRVVTESGKAGIRYFYYFDQGNMHHYEIEDVTNSLVMPGIADKVEKVAKRGIQELFGCLKIGVVCIVLFIVELLKFVCRDLVGPLLLGSMSAIGDHLLKPTYSGVYNCAVQPIFVLLWNVLSGLRHALGPCFDITREITGQMAAVLKGFRLVETNHMSGIPNPLSKALESGVETV